MCGSSSVPKAFSGKLPSGLSHWISPGAIGKSNEGLPFALPFLRKSSGLMGLSWYESGDERPALPLSPSGPA